MIPTTIDVEVHYWLGAYDENWRDLIVPDAFAHPAKVSRGLIVRIIDHLLTTGALTKGDLVLDPFGGIGTTGIEAASRGLRSIGVELEPRFVALAHQNIDLHRPQWTGMGFPIPVMVQGDSRHLRDVLTTADAVVSSPPFLTSRSETTRSVPTTHGGPAADRHHTTQNGAGYGDSPGNLEGLMPGTIDAVISSPPYAEIATGAGGLNTKPAQHHGQQSGRAPSSASQDTDQRYGDADGQLAKMPMGEVDAVVSSPPFLGDGFGKSNTHSGNKVGMNRQVVSRNRDASIAPGEQATQIAYAETTEGNLAALRPGDVDAVVTSPPYEGMGLKGGDQRTALGDPSDVTRERGRGKSTASLGHDGDDDYGTTVGQLGCTEGETFWTAAAQIVRECYAVLKPGGTAVWIVKQFVRDKQLVDFPGDWRRLCEHVGFETIEEVHAMLVSETTHGHLFDGEVTTRRERKSFFRRLAEKKGSPKIDYEVVWIMRKPG